MYKTKNHVINAFKAAGNLSLVLFKISKNYLFQDLDGNGTIDLYEFMLLFRFIESIIYYFYIISFFFK